MVTPAAPIYEALFVDAESGDVLSYGVPLTFDSPFQFKMGDVGQWSAHFPADHPKATHANLEDGDREVTVLRNDVPIINGPFDWEVDSDSRMVNLTVYEASAYFDQMVVESFVGLNEDRFAWVRDVWTDLTTKTSTAGDGTGSPGSSINAGWPNFDVSSGTSGFTLDSAIVAADLVSFRDVLDKLSEDPDEGIEWCLDYGTGSSRSLCQRTLVLGAPLGSTLTRQATDWNLRSYGRSGAQSRSTTRQHLRWSGGVVTKQNTGSVSAGRRLREAVVDRSGITDATVAANAAREFRRRSQPPVRGYKASYVPGRMLPYGWVGLGDVVPLEINDPAELLNVTNTSRRVVEINVTPPSGNTPEIVALTFNLPLDEDGS